MRHWDISNSFLYGNLEPEEYVQMRQPDGIQKQLDEDGNELVCLIKKPIYGLRSAPRIWKENA
jgi:hypothetical protein